MNYNAEHVAIPGEENEIIDFKVVKRHFPRTNNTQVLDFVFEKVLFSLNTNSKTFVGS